VKYLARVLIKTGDVFRASFTNGAETDSHDVACFFMVMQDKGIAPADLPAHIKLGEMFDPGHDWKETRRIAATFTQAKGAAA
jgi:hypothetical protein